MNYILKPSLEHIALVNVAAALWNPHNIRALMTKLYISFRSKDFKKRWVEIEDIILKNVSKLPLPVLLKNKTLDFVRAFGFQILSWIEYHRNGFSFYVCIPNQLYWLPRGAINKKKTVEMLSKDEFLDITERYKLACIYCLEECILVLWNKMPEDRRISFYYKTNTTYVTQHNLVILWTYDITGQVNKVRNIFEIVPNYSPYQYAFEYAADAGNEVATEHFFQKLNSSERKVSLVRTACFVASNIHSQQYLNDYYSNILCVLLSQMTNDEQLEVFEDHSYHVLRCFLDWPRQIFFLKTATRMWNFFTEEVYDRLLQDIVRKIKYDCKDFNYQKLFGEMWQQSSIALKRHVFDTYTFNYLMLSLFAIRDENNIKLMFEDASMITKNKLIHTDCGLAICNKLIKDEQWDLLRYFMQECLTSKDEMLKFKEVFRNSSHKLFRNDRNMTEKK